MYLLDKSKLENLLDFWGNSFDVYGPVKQDDDVVHFLPYNKEGFTMDYINFTMAFKKYLFDQKEVLFRWKKVGDNIEIIHNKAEDVKKRIFFGVRSCDAYSIDYLDLFFHERYKDDNYAINRERSYIIAVNCIESGENCYCNSMGTGPFASRGYDLLFTPMGEQYLIESNTVRGDELIAMAPHYFEETIDNTYTEKKEALLSDVLGRFVKKLEVKNPRKVLDASFDSEIWKELSKTCMGCTGCTSVCPTCTCFNVVDEDKGNGEGIRARYWDSCQSDSFTRNAGGHNPRNEISRVRYRIYDKMKYIDERFDLKGCTGCGRCIDVCPAFIDIVDIMDRLNKEYEEGLEEKVAVIEEQEIKKDTKDHDCSGECSYIYTPKVAIIKEIIQETNEIKRFVVEYEDKSLHETLKFSGQFFKITVFGVGEIAISIPSGDFKKDYFEFYIKKAGKVTTVLHNMKIGDKVGLRGPFGKGFPYDEIKGRDIIIVGSGVGLAPVELRLREY